KNDVSTVASAVTSYTTNNRGTFPTTANLTGYLDDLSDNIDKTQVTVNSARPTSVAPEDAAIVIASGMKCGASTNTSQALTRGAARQFAVVTKLESGGGQYFCQTS